jgi:hypothetical protein
MSRMRRLPDEGCGAKAERSLTQEKLDEATGHTER